MDKQRKWQLFLILTVIALTIYNILPTVFYYLKPLRSPIELSQGENIAAQIAARVDKLEKDSAEWLASFCDLIQVKPKNISLASDLPEFFSLDFSKSEEAAKFRALFPKSGSLIAFPPAQLSLGPQPQDPKKVLVARRLPLHLQGKSELFSFFPVKSTSYRTLLADRAAAVAHVLAGPSEAALYIKYLEEGNPPTHYLETIASEINALSQIFPESSPLSNLFLARFTQGNFSDRTKPLKTLIAAFDQMRDAIKKEKNTSPDLQILENKLISAESSLKERLSLFAKGKESLSLGELKSYFEENRSWSLEGFSPFFSELFLDTENSKLQLKWRPEISSLKEKSSLFGQLVIDEMAKIRRITGESLEETDSGVILSFTSHPEASSFLAIDLEKIAEMHLTNLKKAIKENWAPEHPDLRAMKIVLPNEYKALAEEEKALSFVLYAPVKDASELFPHLHNQSVYLIAKGIKRILQNYQEFPENDLAKTFAHDFQSLQDLLNRLGFYGYLGSSNPFASSLANDFLFEKPDYYAPILKASRESFSVLGTKKYALLELSDVEERLLTENRIETEEHNDLLKSWDEYRSNQVSLTPHNRFDTPKPTKSPFWSNLTLSLRKYFRGDERKILRWGLDLSGGKTVQIELRDANGKVVTGDAEINQGINELYSRVNKMGVSEVTIRSLGHHIVLDFPGSQALSAAELIKASTMRFHMVNEKFSLQNSALRESTSRFLQEIWNEAVVKGKTDPESIQKIAYAHLHGSISKESTFRSESAETLWNQGLRLADPDKDPSSFAFDETLSKVAILRGDKKLDWQGQSHPLMIVFHNFALEGSHLENIHAQYDPSKGNFLSFSIRGSFTATNGEEVNPRGALYEWSSRFSKDKVLGTPKELYSNGQGWRMAVILNDTIISAPTLNEQLKDSAMISGRFSQREVAQLVADLKAGSMTFTPHILSEKNVSPELGKADRMQGIAATFLALFLVIGAMVAYYRFLGVIASVAVLFNLLILWATLQNLGATLTLAGIAGIILTVGMAVDANVLVFERMKEEFEASKKLQAAINIGYKKAFSAIIDSNVTTILAGLILLNFDAGPIKSFAVNLIIGIASSMFTALFMTRFYFEKWASRSKNKELKMAAWFQKTEYNFLKKAKFAFAFATVVILGGGYLLYAGKGSVLGMDFTGGYALNLTLDQKEGALQRVEKAFLQAGLETKDFQIRQLHPENNLRLLLGKSLEEEGRPFYKLPLEVDASSAEFDFEKNPRISWVVALLKKADISLTPQSLTLLSKDWTSMSGQMSDNMRSHALWGLLISFISIFIYLAFRFEYKFAAAALVCIFHDLFLTLGLIGILHKIGVAVQIDLNTVAALMTIIGYSLNDTIIIFDRIREEMQAARRKPLTEIINYSLNVTLGRTTITSGTTLLVLLALVLMGGPSIFSFSLVMALGVFFGTLSSWFIASPLMLFFHRREESKYVEPQEITLSKS